jgi:hypothetical protein
MSENTNTETAAPEASEAPKKAKAPVAPVKVYPLPTDPIQLRRLKKHLRKKGREKRNAKLATNKEFAKTYFEAKSTRSTAKKSTFRKKKSKKK